MRRLPVLFLVLAGLVCGPVARAQVLPEAECFENEIDPQTGRRYQNRAQWEADRKELWEKAPAAPGILRLTVGYQVAMQESKKARGPDKRQHCYVGCRIAHEVGHDVAVYAGYYKEDKDILDCDPKTHFDLKDLEATIRGADLAAGNQADAAFCAQICRREFRK